MFARGAVCFINIRQNRIFAAAPLLCRLINSNHLKPSSINSNLIISTYILATESHCVVFYALIP